MRRLVGMALAATLAVVLATPAIAANQKGKSAFASTSAGPIIGRPLH
ncbi:MAG: hypothetical protein QOD40_1415, partial [Alphaproteobacteria bacterium]|nr:hypothetical protein [Alphaproteobacteria bacterium]